MAPEIYWVREVTTGRLGIMARPRSGEWLRDEVSGWCQVGVNAVVCLLEASEVSELELHDEPVLCEGSKIDFISFPITDRGVPKSVHQTAQLVERVASLLRTGASVVIHCRAGIGRSSLIAACVMWKLGFPHNEIFPMLRRARGLPVPDSPTQEQWLSVFSREAQTAL
jgi:protein-tyrosine phosphatase